MKNPGKLSANDKSGESNRKVILVVDDEPNICNALQRILESDGYTVVTALDGKAALNLIPQLKPNLLFLDIMMPGMDGREVCERAHEICDARIVYFSARADLARTEGEADAFLTKPASSRRILSVVDLCLSACKN